MVNPASAALRAARLDRDDPGELSRQGERQQADAGEKIRGGRISACAGELGNHRDQFAEHEVVGLEEDRRREPVLELSDGAPQQRLVALRSGGAHVAEVVFRPGLRGRRSPGPLVDRARHFDRVLPGVGASVAARGSDGSKGLVEQGHQKRTLLDVLDAMGLELKEPHLDFLAEAPELEAGARPVAERARASAHPDFELPALGEPVVEQLLEDLPLDLELERILQVLPLAAAAPSEMGTRRLLSPRSGFDQLGDHPPDEVLLAFDRPHADPVAGDGERNEDHLSFVPAEPHAAVDELVDPDLERGRGGARRASGRRHR